MQLNCKDCGIEFGIGVDKFALTNEKKMTRSGYRCKKCFEPVKNKIETIRRMMKK